MMSRNEMTQRNQFYHRWARTDTAKLLRAPSNYGFLLAYPDNFKLVREQFHLAWITHKMTEM